MPRNDGGILSWGDMNKPYSLLKLSGYAAFGCTLHYLIFSPITAPVSSGWIYTSGYKMVTYSEDKWS